MSQNNNKAHRRGNLMGGLEEEVERMKSNKRIQNTLTNFTE